MSAENEQGGGFDQGLRSALYGIVEDPHPAAAAPTEAHGVTRELLMLRGVRCELLQGQQGL